MRIFMLALVVTSLLSALPSYADDKKTAYSAWYALSRVEQQHGIPHGLLHSMSLVETGQGLKGKMLPWPYTINVNTTKFYTLPSGTDTLRQLDELRRVGFRRFDVRMGQITEENLDASSVEKKVIYYKGEVQLRARGFAKRFSSAEQAVSSVKNLFQLGHENVDVGLMQVNWYYHGGNFASLEDAFDPVSNVSYAVKYLQKHRETRDWWRSVGRYHSGTPEHAQRYIRNVWDMYQLVHRMRTS